MLAAMIQVTSIPMTAWNEDARKLTENVTVLVGPDNGAYPSGNSVVVQGAGETVIIDPSVTVVERGGAGVPVDAVINSHAHEDHLAGNGFFADAKIHIHHDDLVGAASLDGLMDVYGLEGQPRTDFGQQVLDEFHYTPRPDAHGFSDGHVFDLGGVSLSTCQVTLAAIVVFVSTVASSFCQISISQGSAPITAMFGPASKTLTRACGRSVMNKPTGTSPFITRELSKGATNSWNASTRFMR